MKPSVNRYYKVFISSTFTDLSDHRQQAILGILKAGHMPVALDNFSPETESKREVITDALASCQFYVIILGARYGTIPEDQERLPQKLRGKSYTEIELQMARDAKLPIIAFIMAGDEVIKQQATPGWVNSDEPRNRDKYDKLRTSLTNGIEKPLAKIFSTPEQIYSEVYAYFQRDHLNVRGYILEPERGSDIDIVLRFSSGNQVARDVVEALGKFSDVDPRLAIEPQKKQALAAAFLDLHGEHIENYFSRVFFESGSTITYLARSLANRLPKRGKTSPAARPVTVLTNNAFAYLYLWLCSGVMCHPVPEGPPDHTYGGMYGPLTGRNRTPDYKLPALRDYDPDAANMIVELKKQVFPSPKDRDNSILLAAASGLQLTSDVNILEKRQDPVTLKDSWEQSTDSDVIEKVRKCRGFHVGSYQNMLFKRCYYLTQIPTFVFIHDDKVDCDVKIGKCHYLFDQGLTWENISTNYPLCLWIACQRTSYHTVLKKCQAHFLSGDWSISAYGESNPYPIVIGHNRAFRAACARANVHFVG